MADKTPAREVDKRGSCSRCGGTHYGTGWYCVYGPNSEYTPLTQEQIEKKVGDKPKAPGEVAWEAYRSALVRTPDRPVTGGYTSLAWEAAAQAVREQVAEEVPIIPQAVTDMARIRGIRKVVMKWGGEAALTPMDEQAQCEHMDAALTEIEKILGVPRPAMVGACAENAAERSKSPPPAKR